ncbi:MULTISPECIES: CDP-diacylglycerol--glycerol-3-phosphate 3-phosphatidyltransferase [Lachnospira]|uniref:CDP-diacylglycerol--glycerol-3-phosphate 3-phosphatidyltransferase n=1 Tax=Lachnospira multipara TaxID=28051 RepID=A0A1H5RPR5_9FIRM|nr:MULTISPECIES: CDP-diacylglycerol--glycerol-3-phosphate 3-phosphatidyltransferase [Lachnospira]MBQ2473357.1 CDP-diacylglycerol--glycerol-3-phosphate 3-phosphatidyltransferase [Lachnospira sp.]MCR5515330.1 CDP-diacylglycerol--glycerol-3-phosphate 3-phosphatidyltransferase [Lachnospira sp.]SEF40316.1 CDP-diacylglycerol--glycerol-3-phosphate 3-phosphatidyltransferase [Lachnospira multipara]
MNLPNKLTIFRVILVPVFLVLLYIDKIPAHNYWAAAIFIIASLTDMLDGKIARKYNLVTNFGKFMDPLADKLLVCSGLIALSDLGKIYGWIVIVIIAREFIISGFRLVASDNGVVIAASWWGKVKTAVTMVTIILVVLELPFPGSAILNQVLIYISLVLTVISLLDYIMKNYKIFLEGAH